MCVVYGACPADGQSGSPEVNCFCRSPTGCCPRTAVVHSLSRCGEIPPGVISPCVSSFDADEQHFRRGSFSVFLPEVTNIISGAQGSKRRHKNGKSAKKNSAG